MAIEYIKRRIISGKRGFKDTENPDLKKPDSQRIEKSNQDLNKYVFEVDNLLTKLQIRQSLIELFNLNPKSIISINTHRPPQKQKQQRSVVGTKMPLKRAILTLKKGETISFDEVKD